MKLEDALLFAALEPSATTNSDMDIAAVCRSLAAGGVDAIQVGSPDPARTRAAVEACREEACLCLVADAGLAEAAAADGVQLADIGESSVARVTLGEDKLIGLAARTRDEILLGFEVGVDYIIYEGEAGYGGVMMGLRESAAVPVYAGGLRDVETAKQVVDTGIYRLCVTVAPEGDITGQMAAYARLLGRSV